MHSIAINTGFLVLWVLIDPRQGSTEHFLLSALFCLSSNFAMCTVTVALINAYLISGKVTGMCYKFFLSFDPLHFFVLAEFLNNC